MVRALLWKEFRDQAAILIALLVMGTGVIATAATLGSSSNLDAGIRDFRAYTNAGRLAVLVLTMAAGVVVGGSLFAGERENETFEFLERLPLTRWKIWRTKIAAGAILATISGIVLISLGLFLGTLGSSGSQTVWVAFAIVLAIVAFAWGAFGSVICDSTLAACGLGLIGAGFLGSIILPVTAVIVYAVLGLTPYSSGIRGELPALAGMYMVAAIPLLFSAILFIAPDQSRYRPRVLVEATAPTPVRARYVLPSWLAPWVALVWLFWRQSRIYLIIGVVLATIAGIAGMPFLFIVWPIGSLIAGTLAGVLNWDDEQTKGSNRYWGERRIPTLKLWLVKLVASFGQMVLCCVPLIGFALIRQVMQLLRSYNWRENPEILPATLSSGLLVDGGAQVYYYLLIWPLYGFAFGHVVGMLFRKTIVSVGVAALIAGPLAAMWLPSLILGGVHHWQLWPVPLLAIITAFLLRRAWAIDRLATTRPLATIILASLLALLYTAGGLAYRAVEAPLVPEASDDLKFAETVPALDSEDAGRLLRQVTSQWANVTAIRSQLKLNLPGGRTQDVWAAYALDRCVREGWPDDVDGFDQWLNDMVRPEWLETFLDAATKPEGPFVNPRTVYVMVPFTDIDYLEKLTLVALVHGLQKQRAGDPAAFLPILDSTLMSSRCMTTMQIRYVVWYAYLIELRTMQATMQWVEQLRGRPELLAKAAAILEKHRSRRTIDTTALFLTERMIVRNSLNSVDLWAAKQLESEHQQMRDAVRNNPEMLKQVTEMETNLLSFCGVVPWERERLHRIVGLGNSPTKAIPNRDLLSQFLNRHVTVWPRPFGDLETNATTHLALAQAVVALRRYALDNNRHAAELSELVPKYLEKVPLDPYRGQQPLRYRVSGGDEVILLHEPSRSTDFGPPPAFVPPTSELHFALGGTILAVQELNEDRPNPEWQAARATIPQATEPKRLSVRTKRGQGIVWSVGRDGADDGGKESVLNSNDRNAVGDILRVVP